MGKQGRDINLAQRVETADRKEPLDPRTRNNYLRLIMGLAFHIRGFDPSKPSESARAILEVVDIDLDEKTIATYISAAHELKEKDRNGK